MALGFGGMGAGLLPDPIIIRFGEVQASGLEIYVTDPAHDDEPFPATVDWEHSRMTFRRADQDAVWQRLVDAANSADASNDAQLTDALTKLASRVLRA